MRRNLNKSIAVVLLMAAVLPGCKKKEEAPAPPPKPHKAAPANPAAQQAPVQKQLSSAVKAPASLDFTRRNDPFKPFAPVAPPPVVAQPGAAPAADVLPIQAFEVTKYKVVGIIAGLNENKALVVDPNGKGYVVHVGMQIGNSNGRIVKITPSTVEVVEQSKEGSRRARQKRTVLTLAKKR